MIIEVKVFQSMEELKVLASCELLPENIELRADPDDISDVSDVFIDVHAINEGFSSCFGESSN